MQTRTEKKQAISELHEKLARAKVAIVAQPKNLDVATVTELRKKFRAQKVDYKVVKNTLAKIAVKGTAVEPIGDLLAGPTAIILGYEDPVSPAKLLQDFMSQKADRMAVRGGWVDGQKIDARGFEALAKMPGKNELRAMLCGIINRPAQLLVSVLNQPGVSLARALKAKSEKAA